jgi:hypothetical protein
MQHEFPGVRITIRRFLKFRKCFNSGSERVAVCVFIVERLGGSAAGAPFSPR